jgi:hypothetical protein
MPPTKKANTGTLDGFLSKQRFELADKHLSKFFFTSGVSFNVLENPHFQDFVNTLSPGYNLPSRYRVSGPLLDEEVKEIGAWKSKVLEKGLILVTGLGDGWSNRNRVGCLNIEAVTPSGNVHFETYKRDETVVEADAEYIASLFNKAIVELGGVEKVVGITTDNEAKMRQVWRAVEAQNPGIVAVPCSAHISNLLLKDIGNMNWVSTVIAKVKQICISITSHTFPLALFRSKVANHPELNGKELELPNVTRFASHFRMMESSYALKGAIRELVIDPLYEQCNSFDNQLQSTVLSGEFWEHVKEAIQVLEPVYSF